MTTWVLILWMFKSGMISHEFESYDACMVALAEARAAEKWINGVCVPKEVP